MDKIKELLEFEDIRATDEQIKQAVARREFNLNSITDDQALVIVGDLKTPSVSGGLAVSNGNGKTSTPAKTKGKGGRRKALPTVRNAAAHTANIANEEITGFAEVLDNNLTAWENDKADQLLARVRNAPKNVMGKFVTDAMEEASEAHSFRAAAGEFTSEFYPVSDAVETQ